MRSRNVSFALIGFCWVVMFGSIAIGLRTPVLCDAGHFYEPMFQWIAEQMREGNVPIWNAHENLGAPVAADATSSVSPSQS